MSLDMKLFSIDESVFNDFLSVEDYSAEWKVIENSKILNIPRFLTNKRGIILMEYMFHFLIFTKELKFSFKKSQKCVHIIDRIFQMICFEERESATKERAVLIIKEEFLSCMKDDKDEIPNFSNDEIKKVSTYFSRTILQMYSAYNYALKASPNEEIVEYCNIQIQTPISPPPLCEFREE